MLTAFAVALVVVLTAGWYVTCRDPGPKTQGAISLFLTIFALLGLTSCIEDVWYRYYPTSWSIECIEVGDIVRGC